MPQGPDQHRRQKDQPEDEANEGCLRRRQRAAKAYGAGHEDLAAVGPYLPGVSVVLVATHWDAFRDQDAELRKVMARALRHE